MNELSPNQSFRVDKGEDERWTTDIFGLEASPIPVSGCTSPEYFQKEMEEIHKKCWINIGRQEEVPKPGDYLVRDYEALNTSILLVRNKNNKIQAFHNICSHRCNKVVWDERGSCSRLVCPFHGWVYGLDGSLDSVPDHGQYFDVKKETHSLAPVATEIWEGFVFINLDPNPTQSLREYMGEEFYSGLAGYPFNEYTRCIAWQMDLNCNYKIMRDAFSELVHLPYLHGKSSGMNMSTADCPVPRALAFKKFDHGGQWSILGNPDAPLSPVRKAAFKHGAATIKFQNEMENRPKLFNPANSKIWVGEMVQLFPSFQLSILVESYIFHNFIPVAVDKCIWIQRLYMREPTTVAERFSQEFSAMHLRDSVLEDGRTMEYTQQVLASGVKKHFNFSDQELLPRFNHLLTQEFAGPYPTA